MSTTRGLPVQAAVAPRPGGPRPMTIVVSLVLAALAGVLAGALISSGIPGGGTPQTDVTTAPDPDGTRSSGPVEPVSVTSFDPVGGSGFRDRQDGTWTTQTYRTAEFGALKPGVGLVLDLGEARGVTSVTVPSATPGLAVQLLAGSSAPTGGVDAMTRVDEATTGSGPTVLDASDASQHRYWMVWVTLLAPVEDGYSATIGTPQVEGS